MTSVQNLQQLLNGNNLNMKMSTVRKGISIILLLLCGTMWAQKFESHHVKEGESIESIAKQYRVTPFNIRKANPEIKQGEALVPNTILVIPIDSKAIASLNEAENEVVKPIQQPEPIGFGKHKVRKKETIYGITQRYNISEEQLKKYNTDLYSKSLTKGMRLRIPKYPKPDPNAVIEAPTEIYVVQAKDTRWSISHKYGISIDSLLQLNPELPSNSDHLSEGQELKLPQLLGGSLEEQEVQLYDSYTVPPKMTMYSIGVAYGISSQEIVKLNPEIIERGGLKEGMVLRLPKKQAENKEINAENYIFYAVKPKENVFRITQNLKLSYDELLALNPDLVNGLKAGMILKLPKSREIDFEVRNSLILPKINLVDSVQTEHQPNILFMLPFRLNKLNLSDAAGSKKAIARSNAIKFSLGYYSGALVALDSIAALGISVNVKTVDNQLDIERTKELLRKENIQNLSAVFGPLDVNSLSEVALQASNYGVPVVAPNSSESNFSHSNVFFTIPTDSIQRDKLLSYINAKRENENIIVIADSLSKGTERYILNKFPTARTVDLKENLSVNIDDFTALLSEENENWVFVETSNFKMVSSVTSILNSSISEEIKVRMFTTNRNRAFENDVISSTHLSNLRFTYPSPNKEGGYANFSRAYRNRFGALPNKYAVRGFDIMYDLLLKLAYKNNLFEASQDIGLTEYNGNKFNYHRDDLSGYFNTACYLMQYDEMEIREINAE